jgi:hypothetical protein
MNPRIYASRAAKQAEYREAKKLGMTCAEYRAHIAAGGKPAPVAPNRAWYGQAPSKVTKPERIPANHIASPKPDEARLGTACGKFQEDVGIVTDIIYVTCSKCRTNYFAAKAKVTPPSADPRPVVAYSEYPIHIQTRCGMMGDKKKALCNSTVAAASLSTVEPEYMESDYEGKHIRILINKYQPNCPACFAKAEAKKAKRSAKVTPDPKLDAVKAAAAMIYPNIKEE